MTTHVVALSYGGPEVLALREVPQPAPGPGEVRIEVRAAGVNPSDGKRVAGVWGSDPAKLPLRVGNEVSGIVTAVGEHGADGDASPRSPFSVGDEVVAFRVTGGWASDVIAKVASVFAKPAGLSWDAAAGLLLVGTTAEHLVQASAVHDGDVVLVHGASGSVGVLAGQLARLRGARVLGTASPRNSDLLARLGFEPVPYGDGLIERVRRLTDHVDAALDTVGTDEAIDASLELVTDRSRIATIAAFERGAQAGIQLLGGGAGADPGTELRDEARAGLIELAGRGAIEIVLGPTFPLTEASAALDLVMTGHPGGKVVLHP